MKNKIEEELSSFEAEKIINALRTGTVPIHYLDLLTSGRESWLSAIEEDLSFVSQGASKIRLIAAHYGGGKTHFLNLIKQKALSNNFAVAYVELNSRESPLDKFEIIFPKVMRSIEILESENGLEAIFDRWIQNFKIYDRQEIEKHLKHISASMDFRSALRSYLEFAGLDSPESKDHLLNILGWLCGNKHLQSFLAKTGIRNSISITNVSDIFGSFLRFIRYNGFSGLLLLLDEAEAVTSLAQSQRRNEANQNMRKLLDNADNHLGFYIIFATTPKFLDDAKVGARSYPALWERIKDVLDLNLRFPNKRALIIPLQPLEKKDLVKIAEIISSIHCLAYRWNGEARFNPNILKQYSEQFQRKSPERLIRTFIRGLVSLLDVAEQNKELDILQEMGKISFVST